LKGGAIHAFNYPICFSFVDLDEILKIGWKYWPIFKLNSRWFTFSSLENCNHLKDLPSSLKNGNSIFDLPNRVREFVKRETNGKEVKSINILTHLTYFGYCFNPVTFYYLNYSNHDLDAVTETESNKIKLNGSEMMIAEVSNTPWIEQHSYMLDESVNKVEVKRSHEKGTFEATWFKVFHVSPFMEMDYKYKFEFSKPEKNIWVKSQLIKLDTNEVWFTASFEMNRIPFTPINILYILLFYPFHTRIIQIWIHYEALKLWLKGIPTFEHPLGSIINFGLGITDRHLLSLFNKLGYVYESITKSLFSTTVKNGKVS
jgi:DUF1365 family protein